MIFTVWIVIQILTNITLALTAKDQLPKSRLTSSLNNATCPFRTINYITHSLPQQRLATFPVLSNGDVQAIARNSSTAFHHVTVSSPPTPVAHIASTSLDSPVSESSSIPDEADSSPSTKPSVNSETLLTASSTLEEDSALESGNFLSFEEWKKRNLKKVGQSEHVGSGGTADFPEQRKRPVNVQNTLDSLGDDAEIDIDFTGFVPGGPERGVTEATHPIAEVPDGEVPDSYAQVKVKSRSKDAGTTCKERFNYASFDCAANILKTNREAKSSNAILLENKDSYMLNQCAAKEKFIILELCNDIQIDTIVLANFEFFSSTFRTFRVSVSDRYPVKADKWISLGVYEARNTREVQAFLVENPVIWARYVRLDFLTHYGKEFYCPISLLRVHGTTMMEEYKHDMVVGTDDDNEDEDSTQAAVTTDDNPDDIHDIPIPPGLPDEKADETEYASASESQDSTAAVNISVPMSDDLETASVTEITPPSVAAYEAISAVIDPTETCVPKDSPTPTTSEQDGPIRSQSLGSEPSIVIPSENATAVIVSDGKPPPTASTTPQVPVSKSNITEHVQLENSNHSQAPSMSTTSSKTNSSTVSTTASSAAKDRASSPGPDRSRSSGSPSQPPHAVPTIQESFFKSVQKRLQMLEANSSLSLQYIEDQSRALRDAFKKVEQRQLTRTTAFLEQLNSTVLNELREFRLQYDQLWQSTIIELEIQRERYERDNEAINARLGLLADEVIFQRRMGILQMVLILVCLVLVLFSRGSINNYLELPLVQNVLSRSPSSKWLNLSNRNSPARPLKAGRAYGVYQSRNGIVKTHRRMHSEDSITDTQSGPEGYLPMTPVSFETHSDPDHFKDEAKNPTSDFEQGDGGFDDPEFDPSTIERPSTSPPILIVDDASPTSEAHHISDEDVRIVQLPDQVSESLAETLHDLTLSETQASNLAIRTKNLTWDLPAT